MVDGFGRITQVAIVVRDIDRAAEQWAKLLGVEKPGIIETEEWEQTQMIFKGAPSRARAKLAFFNLDGITIELIEPIGAPSTWSEFLEQQGEGIHHIAFVVDDIEAAIEKLKGLGGTLVQRGDFEGGSYAYIDARRSLGAIVELLNFHR